MGDAGFPPQKRRAGLHRARPLASLRLARHPGEGISAPGVTPASLQKKEQPTLATSVRGGAARLQRARARAPPGKARRPGLHASGAL